MPLQMNLSGSFQMVLLLLLRCCKSLISLENLCALAAIPARTFNTLVSTFLEYVWPDTG